MTKTQYPVAPPLWQQPTAQQLRLLQASLGEGEPALSAWQAWRASADLNHLPPGGFGLLPLLAHNLQRHGVTDALLNKCQGIHRQVWSRNQIRLSTLLPLLQGMENVGILPIVYADTALMLFHYPQSGLRAVDAIHLATPADQTAAMLRALTAGGWQLRPTANRLLRVWQAARNRSQPVAPAQESTALLQWQPLSIDATGLITREALDGRPLTMHGIAVASLSPTELLLHTCAHGIVAQQRYGAIQWIADAAMILQRTPSAIDWPYFIARTQQAAVTLRMLGAFYSLHRTLAISVPSTVLAELQAIPLRPIERWERQLFTRRPGAARQPVLRLLGRKRYSFPFFCLPPTNFIQVSQGKLSKLSGSSLG